MICIFSILIVMTDAFKKAIRSTCLGVREALSPGYQKKISLKICKQIRQIEQYRYAKRIALYQATSGEIDLSNIWKSAPLQGKFCYFPSLKEDRTLSFLPTTPSTPFIKNRFGIEEPDVLSTLAISPDELDLMIVPLVAFDERGMRLGRGGGYYDRTLAHAKPSLLMGVAYEFQRQPYLEAQAWDIPLDLIITEKTIYWSETCRTIG